MILETSEDFYQTIKHWNLEVLAHNRHCEDTESDKYFLILCG
jgi:hypothetical protein